LNRRYFPPTEFDLKGEEEWEEVEAGESAENGVSQDEEAEKGNVEDLPEVPTNEPLDNGPAPKKQKSSQDGGL
jgi:hypothetical protein